MTVRVGDVLFKQSGQPGLVSDRNEATSRATVELDRGKVTQAHRHGYINGLSIEQRQDFDAILDKVKEIPDPQKRVDELKGKIDDLGQDPKNFALTKYLNAEMAHLMNTAGLKPRIFEADLDRLR